MGDLEGCGKLGVSEVVAERVRVQGQVVKGLLALRHNLVHGIHVEPARGLREEWEVGVAVGFVEL
jgi:hypothetical protein